MPKRSMSLTCFAVIAAWAASAAAARGGPDRSGYEWVDSDETAVTYEWLDVGATPTCVTLADDAETAAIPIGFTFTFYDVDYTELRIGSNGYVSFKGNSLRAFVGQCPLPQAGTRENPSVDLAIYGYFQDLNPAEPTSGTICYAVLGTAPDRQFVVTYDTIDIFQGTAEPLWGTDPVTFQIVLYETTNEAQVNIQESGVLAGRPRWFEPTQIGIENADGTMGIGQCDWHEGHLIPDNYAVRFRRSDTFGIIPPTQVGTGGAGVTVDFDFELLNFSAVEVTGAVEAVSASGWTATPSVATVTAAADGGSATFSVGVTVPAAATGSERDTVTVTVTSGTDVATATIHVWATLGDDDWQSGADLPEAMTQVVVVADGTYVYALAGETLETVGTITTRVLGRKTYRWDPSLNGWDDCAVADLPYAVTLGGACVMNGHIYYVGGLSRLANVDTGDPALFAPDLLDYDIAADTWTPLTGPTFPTMSPSVVCDAGTDRVYVYGGYIDVDQNSEVEIPSTREPLLPDTTIPMFQMYDVGTAAWRDDLATADEKTGLAAAAVGLLGGKIYLAGGQLQVQDERTGEWGDYITRQTVIYDTATDAWTDGPMLDDYNRDPVGAVYRDRFCVIAGSGTSGRESVTFTDWWCLNDPMWVVQSDPLPDPITSLGGTVMGDHIYLAGGMTGAGTPDVVAVATFRRWPTDTLPGAIDPVPCAADADADADADAGDDVADVPPEADGAGDVAADTGGPREGGGGGCGCRVAARGRTGALLAMLFILGAVLLARRSRSNDE